MVDITLPRAVGPQGPRGPQGPEGPPAQITENAIVGALGFTPADGADVAAKDGSNVEADAFLTELGIKAPQGAELVGLGAGNTVAKRLSGEWSVFDNLTAAQVSDVMAKVVGDDLAPSIQEMLSDSAIKSLTFPPGLYKVVSSAAATEALLLERNINLIAPGGPQKTTIVGHMPGNTTGAMLRVKMIGSGDVRNWTMKGLALYPEPSIGGKNGLVIANDGLPMLTCVLEDLLLGRNAANAGSAAVLGYVFAHSLVVRNTFSGGVVAECGDANLFQKNLSFGKETGYTFNLRSGVRNNTLADNTIVNTDGALHVINADEIRFTNNQCEQVGLNGNAVQAMVWLEGRDRPITNAIVKLNNLGGGTNVKTSVYVDNARGAVIDENSMIAPGQDSQGGNADVIITAKAVGTVVGVRNSVRGTAFSPRLDGQLPVRSIDAGIGSIGTIRTDLSPQNGWLCAGAKKDEAGVIQFASRISGGTVTEGDTILTLPQGMWPMRLRDNARRNLLTDTVFPNSWTRSGVAAPEIGARSPFLRPEASLFVALAGNNSHSVRSPGVPVASGVRHHFSFYLKRASEASQDRIRFGVTNENLSTFQHAVITLSTGAITNFGRAGGGAGAITATDAGGGWWRLDVDYTPPTSENYYISLSLSDQSTAWTSFTSDPAINRVLFFGPHAEVGTALTNYQAVIGPSTFETPGASTVLPVLTTSGTGSISISWNGVMKVVSLPSADFAGPPILAGHSQ